MPSLIHSSSFTAVDCEALGLAPTTYHPEISTVGANYLQEHEPLSFVVVFYIYYIQPPLPLPPVATRKLKIFQGLLQTARGLRFSLEHLQRILRPSFARCSRTLIVPKGAKLTMLHRTVLGLVGNDLKTELDASTKAVNAVDFSRRTPLSMDAGRSDLPAVMHLLDYAAGPNISSPSQGSPLHFAAVAKEPDCLWKLISYNAHVDGVTNWDQTPLHHVAAYENDNRHASILIKACANVNAKDRDGITFLQWTMVSDNEKVAGILLSHGAHVNNIDNHGNSALLEAKNGGRSSNPLRCHTED